MPFVGSKLIKRLQARSSFLRRQKSVPVQAVAYIQSRPEMLVIISLVSSPGYYSRLFGCFDMHLIGKQCYFDYCWTCLVAYDMVRHIGGSAHAKGCHLWTDETPTQYKARKAVDRREAKDYKAANPLKRKRGEADGVSEDGGKLKRSV